MAFFAKLLRPLFFRGVAAESHPLKTTTEATKD